MNDVYEKAALILGIDKKDVKDIYEHYWKFIRETIESLPLKEDLSKEDFQKLKTNFNIPSLGKLSCDYSRYLKIKKINKIKIERDENKKSKTPS